MEAKSAIMDPADQFKLLKASRNNFELQTLVILRKWGPHIGVISDPRKYKVKVENNRASWRRGKGRKRKKDGKKIPGRRISWGITRDVSFFEDYIKRNKWKKYTRVWYFIWINEVGKLAGLKNVSPNSLRHTAAWNLALKGEWSSAEISAKLGCVFKTAEDHYLLLKDYDETQRAKWKKELELMDAPNGKIVKLLEEKGIITRKRK